MTRDGGFREKLGRSFEGFLESPEITILDENSHQVRAVVVSPTFEGLNSGKRQEIVWDRVLKSFDVNEWRRIEFIYTNSPSEYQTA